MTDIETHWVHLVDGTICGDADAVVHDAAGGIQYGGLGRCDDHDRLVKRVQVKPDLSQAIEILHTRDPDGYCTVELWIGGIPQLNVTEVSIDPGAGIPRSDWEENKATNSATGTEAFRAAVAAAYEAFDNNTYIQEDGWTEDYQKGKEAARDLLRSARQSGTMVFGDAYVLTDVEFGEHCFEERKSGHWIVLASEEYKQGFNDEVHVIHRELRA